MKIYNIDAKLLFRMFGQSALVLNENKEAVDKLNVFPVPDGDTGTNMALTLSKAIEDISALQDPSLSVLVNTMSKGCLMGARGNSGVILSQIFRGFAKYAENLEEISVRDFAYALDGSAKTAYNAVLKPVEGTILTVIKDVAAEAIEIADDDIDFEEFFAKILAKGRVSLENTPNLLKPLKEAGVVDAGGMGLLYILSGFSEAVEGKAVDLSVFQGVSKLPSEMPAQAHINPDEIKFTYCTEFIIEGEKIDNDALQPFILSMGDSVVYVPDDNVLKVHVHTNEPGVVLTEALKYGHIVKTKIENMRLQHSGILEEAAIYHDEKVDDSYKDYAIITVASGDGMKEIFKSLHVDTVITGGQTMNPSTNDILEATEKFNAGTIFVLPNNSNIILAANQAAEISDKNIVVVPTKTVPQGVSSLIAFDEHRSPEENLESFMFEIENVKSIQITYAVRDTSINGVDVSKDNYIGIVDGEIKFSETDLHESSFKTIGSAIDEDSSIVSIYYGENVEEDAANELVDRLSEEYEDIDFELHYGGQPVYYYIVSVE